MKTFKKSPIAIAMAALFLSGHTIADGFDTDSEIDSKFDNKIDVSLEHDADTEINFNVRGGAYFKSNNYAGAMIDSKQLQEGNIVINDLVENEVSIEGNALRGASGNIGVNAASGDNNQQANDAALAVSDARHVFGQASAYSAQSSNGNVTINTGTQNTANLGGNALRGASGNVGVNVASGSKNTQL